jgi:hypothetical protein
LGSVLPEPPLNLNKMSELLIAIYYLQSKFKKYEKVN